MEPVLREKEIAVERFLTARTAFSLEYKVFLTAAQKVAAASGHWPLGNKKVWDQATAEYDRSKIALDQLGEEMKAAGDNLERIIERESGVEAGRNQD